MEISLRPYQIKILDQLWSAMQVKKNVLCQAPCSSGKTLLFSKIIQRLLKENSNFRCLILLDREILVSQSWDKLIMVAPELADNIGIVCASVTPHKELIRRVTIASRQTLINQLDGFEPVKLIICDECHLMPMRKIDKDPEDQYGRILQNLWDKNPNMRLLGFTASPYRLGSKGGYIYGDRNAPDVIPYFDRIDATVSNKEMIGNGYIVPIKGYARVSAAMTEDLATVNKIAGEYNIKELADVLCKELHITACVTAYKEFAEPHKCKKTVIFCTTIDHCEQVAQAFIEAGYPALAIHSKLTKQENQRRMDELATGITQIFTSVAKLTTGLDVDIIDCLILARPTESTSLFQQMIGRAQRLAPGKKDCLLIDLVGNTQTFGLDMDNLYVKVPKGSGGGEAPSKICPGTNMDGTICGKKLHAAVLVCPDCGFIFPKQETQDRLGLMEKVSYGQTDLEPPEWYDVESMSSEIWFAKSGKQLLRISLKLPPESAYAAPEIISVWICFSDNYTGYAVDAGYEKWVQFSDEDFPDTVEEGIFLAEATFKIPSRVLCQRKKDGYLEAINFEFGETEDEKEITINEDKPEDRPEMDGVYDSSNLPF